MSLVTAGLLSTFALAAPSPNAAPEVAPSMEPAPLEDDLRAELRALREKYDAQERESARIRQELRQLQTARRPERERVAFGDVVRVDRGEELDDVVAFGSDIVIEGRVTGNATAFGGNVRVLNTGMVAGDAVSFGGRVLVAPGGRVLGDRVALEDPTGTTTSVAAATPAKGTVHSMLSVLYHRLVLLLSFAGAGILVIGLFPQRVERVAQGLELSPIWNGIVGVTVSTVVVVFSALFALVTLGLGAPVSLLAMGLLGAAWLFGFVGLCQAIGDRLPFANKPQGRWLTFLVGTILLSCIGTLPWVGWLVVISASMVGVGASITSRFGAN